MTKQSATTNSDSRADSRVVLPFVRNPYNYDTMEASNASAIDTSIVAEGEAVQRTQQQFTEEVDVNNIMNRFIKGGDISINSRQPKYGDFTGMPTSYHEALNFVKDAERAFMSLDATIRAKFDNDAGRFLAWANDPANTEELIALGLADRVPTKTPPDTDGAVGDLGGKPPKAAKPSVKASNEASGGNEGGE